MDVRDLAPALLGMGQLFDAANALLNGDAAKVRVQVKATEPGCFQITFDVIQSLGDHLITVLIGPKITAAANLIGLISGGVAGIGGLIWLIKKLKGGSPDKVEPLESEMVRLSFGDQHVDIPVQLLRLYQDVAVRTAAQRIIEEPLTKDGIDSFEIRENLKIIIRVNQEEAIFFQKPQIPDEVLLDDVRRSAFSIISLAFKEDRKWRLNDGTNPINATIEDDEFLSRVDNNQVAFSKGDILICDVKVVQRRTDAGLKTDYTVIRVVEHIPAARQIPFQFEIRDDEQ